MANEKEAGEVDLDAVNKLVAALQCDVEKLRGDSPDVQRLKDELQTLRNVLDSPLRRPHWVRDGLHGIRDSVAKALDEMVVDGIKSGQYLAEVGRILGVWFAVCKPASGAAWWCKRWLRTSGGVLAAPGQHACWYHAQQRDDTEAGKAQAPGQRVAAAAGEIEHRAEHRR